MAKYRSLLALLLISCANHHVLADPVLGSSPPLVIRMVALDQRQSTTRGLLRGEAVRSDEQAELQLTSEQAAYLYVVLYSPAGESTLIHGDADPRRAVSKEPVHITVPRIMKPGGEPLPELRLFVVASAAPLEPTMYPLLRLRYPLDQPLDGSRDDGKSKDGQQGGKESERRRDTGGQPAQPGEGKPKRGDGSESIGPAHAAPGVYTPVTVIPIVLQFE
jgi:hypothetical protein